MEKKRSLFTATGFPQNSSASPTTKSSLYNLHAKSSEKVPDKLTEPVNPSRLKKQQEKTKKAKGDCNPTPSSSGTQFFKKGSHRESYVRITTDEYFGQSESISGSSQTFHCIHGPEGKLYTEKTLLKRNLLKELDPIALDPNWNDKCPNAYGWGLAQKLEFLITDSVGVNQFQRLEAHLRDFAKLSSNGYKVHVLDSVSVIVDYLVETLHKPPNRREALKRLLVNMSKPILLNGESDCITHFENIRTYMGFMGYLLMRMEDDSLFSLVSDAIIWQLSAPDSARGLGAVRRRHVLLAAAPTLYQTTVRMLAVTDAHRFPTFLEVALLLALDSADSCTEMMKENIIENLFYRFNPYFPDRRLPFYDINPADPQDCNVKLGDSGVNLPTVLSVLLVLLRTTKDNMEKDPNFRTILPHPDDYSQRCFVWAYRYECRAREHQHERVTMTAIVAAMLHVFGNRLTVFSVYLMPDLMSLSVLTELPRRTDWIKSVNFSTGQVDVNFKKMLIKLCVQFVKVFPVNHFAVESRYWLLGLMYLVDPGLCYLRARWSPVLFAELRRIALQAMVCVLPFTPPRLAVEYGLIRRIMWYIEWYSESPFELPVLYWCLRLLQEIVSNRDTSAMRTTLTDLFDTHGIIIIIHLCYTLMDQKMPPIEKAQAVISLNLRLLTSAVDDNRRLVCCVYPAITWPSSINNLVKKMVESVLYSLDKHLIVSDRWLVSLMNFIWEGVIWNPSYRKIFIADNGIYKLLDLITMSRAPVQCIALAMVCDVARDGGAVGQLVSWRANPGATRARPNLVKRGATIAALLAAIFRDELAKTGVSLDENGIIQDLECPIMSAKVRKAIYHEDFKMPQSQRSAVCLSAGDLSGSRLSKAFALLHLLSDDLEYMVNLADESYNMYKNIKLSPEDESVLVICSNYMTLKLNEVWVETHIQSPVLEPQDHDTLQEFLHIGNGWAKAVKRQQEDVIEKDRKKGSNEESSFYTFMARVRLNIALDALREVRCGARSADRARITNALIHDAVLAHHRRSVYVKKLEAPVLRTYGPKLDDQNMTGQNVKVNSIFPKNIPKPKNDLLSPSNVVTIE